MIPYSFLKDYYNNNKKCSVIAISSLIRDRDLYSATVYMDNNALEIAKKDNNRYILLIFKLLTYRLMNNNNDIIPDLFNLIKTVSNSISSSLKSCNIFG